MSRVQGHILAAAALGVLVACQAPPPKVEGWRPLTAQETGDLRKLRQAESPENPPPVTRVAGDFNDDGRSDTAMMMLSDAGDRFSVWIFDGAGGPPKQVDSGGRRDVLHRFSLAAMGSGAIYSFCTEQAEDYRDCERDKDEFNGQALIVYRLGEGGSIYGWNGHGLVERTLQGKTRRYGAAEIPEVGPPKAPWYGKQSPMARNPDLPTFKRG